MDYNINTKKLHGIKVKYSALQTSFDYAYGIMSDRRKGVLNGLKTSLTKLDKVIGNWQFGNYYCIAGRPGSGKSAFLNQIILDFFRFNENEKIIVVYFNYEMSNYIQLTRFVSNITGFRYNQLMNNDDEKLSAEDFELVGKVKNRLKDFNILFIDDALSVKGIYKTIEAIVESNPDHKVVVALDHSRLPLKEKGQGEMDMINALSKMMMLTKKEFNTMNILVSQLNRNIESNDRMKDYFRPMLTDIFGADSIGQDIETAVMLHRPETYKIPIIDKIPTKDKIFLEIPKNRNGNVGTVLLEHDLSRNLIKNAD